MTTDEIIFWNDYPKMLPLYEKISSVLEERYPNMSIKVSKTQISFYNRHMFAMVSTSKKRKKRLAQRISDALCRAPVSFGASTGTCFS